MEISRNRAGQTKLRLRDDIQRVFKKSAPNNKLTLYLGSRDIIITNKRIDRIQGVVLVEPDYLRNKKLPEPKKKLNLAKYRGKELISGLLEMASSSSGGVFQDSSVEINANAYCVAVLRPTIPGASLPTFLRTILFFETAPGRWSILKENCLDFMEIKKNRFKIAGSRHYDGGNPRF
ncbi:hypothetical protein AAG570_011028 [Ranatra chinensis]|uniref:Uncharacterized protein n=1 Tax=Ranatra chinensis TaxID=642074 RepID=A0ABD0YJF6_9HEMI